MKIHCQNFFFICVQCLQKPRKLKPTNVFLNLKFFLKSLSNIYYTESQRIIFFTFNLNFMKIKLENKVKPFGHNSKNTAVH